jgi:hypothetical protein
MCRYEKAYISMLGARDLQAEVERKFCGVLRTDLIANERYLNFR